jgi:hypothetical protein
MASLSEMGFEFFLGRVHQGPEVVTLKAQVLDPGKGGS